MKDIVKEVSLFLCLLPCFHFPCPLSLPIAIISLVFSLYLLFLFFAHMNRYLYIFLFPDLSCMKNRYRMRKFLTWSPIQYLDKWQKSQLFCNIKWMHKGMEIASKSKLNYWIYFLVFSNKHSHPDYEYL